MAKGSNRQKKEAKTERQALKAQWRIPVLPTTVEDAVEMLVERLTEEERQWLVQYGRDQPTPIRLRRFAMFVRSLFDLFHNRPLRRSCGDEDMRYETAGAIIIDRLIDRLREQEGQEGIVPHSSTLAEVIPMEDDFLTREQLSAIGELLHMGFKKIRRLSWEGRSEQAADLADALLQIPLRMFSQGFSCEMWAKPLEAYEAQYPAGLVPYSRLLRHVGDNPIP